MQRQPLPPMMQAPDRSKPIMHAPPRLPSQFKRDAEQVVIQAAKELTKRHPDIADLKPLNDAIQMLKSIEGIP